MNFYKTILKTQTHIHKQFKSLLNTRETPQKKETQYQTYKYLMIYEISSKKRKKNYRSTKKVE